MARFARTWSLCSCLLVSWNSVTSACRYLNRPTPHGPVFFSKYSLLLNIFGLDRSHAHFPLPTHALVAVHHALCTQLACSEKMRCSSRQFVAVARWRQPFLQRFGSRYYSASEDNRTSTLGSECRGEIPHLNLVEEFKGREQDDFPCVSRSVIFNQHH